MHTALVILLLALAACSPAPSPADAAVLRPPAADATVHRDPSSADVLKEPPSPPAPRSPVWPSAGAPLTTLTVTVPKDVPRVYVDAGHGAPANDGTRSAACEDEQDFTLRTATDLGDRLTSAGFVVRESRAGDARPSYPDRIRDAERWRADALISLHEDARAGVMDPTSTDDCPRNHGAAGFAVLYSDEGDAGLVVRRLDLAEAVAARMVEAGFPAYDGVDYDGLYAPVDGHPGVFVDRHDERRRIQILRRPKVPSIIVETHQAWDPDEDARWKEDATAAAFASAIGAALVDVR